jgi:uncharacterized damage-inducible protein DinB
MTVNEISDQLENVYSGRPWFGMSVLEKLNDIPPENIHKKINAGHSIAELISHMIAWRNYVIEKLNGNKSYKIQLNSKVDWPDVPQSAHLNDLVTELQKSQYTLLEKLKQSDDSLLEADFNEKGHKFKVLLDGIIQHDIYHLGQIAILNSLLKKGSS